MSEMKRCECQGGFDVEIIAPDGTPITFPTRAEMQAALIAQYDAIVAAVIKACPVVVHLETYDMYNTILEAITQHDPRKGAE